MTDAKQEHKAVVLFQVEVHEVLETGECSGKLVPKSELEKYGIKPKQVLSVSGQNRTDCLKKLKGIIDGFK